MALSFLSDIGNFANTVNQAAGPIGQIIAAIKGNKGAASGQQSLRDQILAMSTNRQPSEAERQSQALLLALAQPGNSLVKQLTDEEARAGTDAMQGDIRSRVLADRREQASGRAPVFFDPERADENIAYQLSRGGAGIRNQAQTNALNRILQAAGVGKFAPAADARFQGNLNSMASIYAMDSLGPNQGGQQQLQPQLPGTLGRVQTGVNGLSALQQIMAQFNKPQQYGPPNQLQYNQMRG